MILSVIISEPPNRALHIGGTFKTAEKVNIDDQQANIEREKVNIDVSFTAKTASHVRRLPEVLGSRTIFGRADVQSVPGLKPTGSTALLKEMAEKGIIEPVSGLGKGKFRFVQRQD